MQNVDTKTKKRLICQTQTEILDSETGEILQDETTQTWVYKHDEPDYVKVYLNVILAERELNGEILTPFLHELLKRMTYANDLQNGQVIVLNSFVKKSICDKLNISDSTFTKNITKLCTNKLIARIGRGTYAVNPFIFGKGDWKSIQRIRATYSSEFGLVMTETDQEIPTKL